MPTEEYVTSYCAGLREAADFIESHPDLCPMSTITFNLFPNTKNEFIRLTKVMGEAEKVHLQNWFIMRRKFGPHEMDIDMQREQICTKRKTGTRITRVPDPEHIATVPMIEVEEDTYEWDCPDSILALKEEA